MYTKSISLPGSVLTCPNPDFVQKVIQASISAADPIEVVERALKLQENILKIANQSISLDDFENVYLLSVGKASLGMAQAVAQALGTRITAGLVIPKVIPQNIPEELEKMRIIPGNHPIPGQESFEAAKHAVTLLERADERDLVIIAISGGGSALMSLPYPGISIEDLQELTRLLFTCGADISEMNTLRKHLDQVKGGGIARAAAPAQVIGLILSDVIGSPLDIIASGPTVPDPSTFKDAMDILVKYGIREKTPKSVLQFIENGIRGEIPETPKPGDPFFNRITNSLVGSNLQSAEAAINCALQQGWNPKLLTTKMNGEARIAGVWLAEVARQINSNSNPIKRPACLVAGGETTVTLRGSGIGGRNQELALGAVDGLAGLKDVLLLTLATDGEDGQTGAAGAAVTGDTAIRAAQLGLDPQAYLERNDSNTFFKALGDVLITGSTGTNVNDLTFLFLF